MYKRTPDEVEVSILRVASMILDTRRRRPGRMADTLGEKPATKSVGVGGLTHHLRDGACGGAAQRCISRSASSVVGLLISGRPRLLLASFLRVSSDRPTFLGIVRAIAHIALLLANAEGDSHLTTSASPFPCETLTVRK